MNISLEPEWRPYDPIAHAGLSLSFRDWLLHAGSFMTRLRERGADPCVHVLEEAWQVAWDSECELLRIEIDEPALVREVLILNKNIPCMYARTIFPPETITGEESQLANLKNRSLGSVLFNDPAIKRSEIEMTCLRQGMLLHKKVEQHAKVSHNELWARRSIFNLHHKELLLTEVFLPIVLTF
jgi:chorismate lyase